MRRTKVASLAAHEMRNLIDLELHAGDKLPFKNPVFDFIRLQDWQEESDIALDEMANTPLEQGVRQEEVLIFASPEDVVASYIELFQLANLSIRAIDLAPLALFRMLVHGQSVEGDLPELFMTLDWTSEQADVAIYHHGIPVFIRSISIVAGSVFDTADARREQYTKALLTELARVANYYKYSISADLQDITVVYYAGDEALSETLPELLSEELKLEFRPVPMNLQSESEISFRKPLERLSYVVPLGLALKTMKG
jgi:type IV pilus assembly protein PilM